MTKIIYNWHPLTGEYVGAGEADLSPLEPDVYLTPAFSTEVAPPAVGAREIAVFDVERNEWIVKVDWRGVLLYSCVDGSVVEIVEIGKTPIEVKATELPRPSPTHDWVKKAWVFNGDKQKAIDAEVEATKRAEFQKELDAHMEAAVAIASPLDYASKRKKLSADKAARLEAYNDYIDALAVLEFSDEIVWPAEPI